MKSQPCQSLHGQALPESAWAIPAEGLSMPMALGNKPSGQELKEG